MGSDARTVALHRYPELDPGHEAVAAYAVWVAQAMDRKVYLGWLAEQAGHVVAGSGLLLLEWGPSKYDLHPWRGRVVNVFTAPAVRRQGIAGAMLQAALQEAQRRGVGTLSLSTSEMARGLYERAGFVPYTSELLRCPARERD